MFCLKILEQHVATLNVELTERTLSAVSRGVRKTTNIVYIYIYMHRERERDVYIYIGVYMYIYIYTYIHLTV